MELSTKERILERALVSFAENGYKGTNLRDLAAGLGLSKSALYRHFDSKEAIWDAVLDRMESYYNARFSGGEQQRIPASCRELYDMAMAMLDFTVNDPQVIITRRLLLVEQFRDERAKHLATAHFLDNTKAIYTGIFSGMMEKGLLKKDDPEMLAFAFTAPITSLIQLCDREPEQKEAAMEQMRAFIRHFIGVYGTEAL